ncbi:hypothetical protein ACFQVC_08490 [Streptomyces monticola]|uniref:Tetratricopeptide repeat protein n=1 Tax=Streptomyces monticola TaxID=2666263 RepID=A0ABW2JEU6_9ACTN
MWSSSTGWPATTTGRVSEARYGTPKAAFKALLTAEALHSRSTSPAGRFTSYPAAALHYQRARALGALGDLPAAIDSFQASLRERATDERRSLTLTHARLAETLLRLGHLAAACEHWGTFLDHRAQLHSSRVQRHVTTLRQQLHPHRNRPDVAQLLARTVDFTAGRR